MRAAKATYFFYFASLSCIFPFLNLFFRRLGLSEHLIGILGATRPFISLPAGSLWSGAADKSRRHRAILLLTLCASVLARLSLAAVGRLGFVPLLAMVAATEAFAAPVTVIVDAAVMAACTEGGSYGRQRLWGAVGWGLFSAVSGSAISHSGIAAAFMGHAVLAVLALAATLRLPFGPLHAKLAKQAGELRSCEEATHSGICDHSDADISDGSCKIKNGWQPGQAAGDGSQAAGTSPNLPGVGRKGPVQRFDSGLDKEHLQQHNTTRNAVLAPTLLPKSSPTPAYCELTSSQLTGYQQAHQQQQRHREGVEQPPQWDREEEETQQQEQQQAHVHFWRGVQQLAGNSEAAIFLAMASTMGFGVGNIEGYLFLFLDELGGSELLMGLSLTVTCAAEALVFYYLPTILSIGLRRCMHLVFAAFLLRMGCYAALQYAPSPWIVLPAEVLHGLTFALAWGAGCAYCEQLSPPGLEATTQGLFQGLYFGLGVGVGSLCGGYVYQRHGAQAVYLAACGVLAAGWLLCSLAQLVVRWLGLERSQDKYLQVANSDIEMNESAQTI